MNWMNQHKAYVELSLGWPWSFSEEKLSIKKKANDNPEVRQDEGRLQIIKQQKYLGLQNHNSLALMVGQSTEKGLPISRNMLSNSEDAFQLQAQSYQQNEPELKVEEARILVDQLGLERLFPPGRLDNTKNVLRNLGNAQNQYALYHPNARTLIQDEISSPNKFDAWVRTLKLQNFQHFKKVWGEQQHKPFIRLYKRVCWDFYCHQAIPYVLSSRMKNPQTKNSHLKYIYRFLQGIRDPQSFNYFKKPS